MDQTKKVKRTNYIALAVVIALAAACVLGVFLLWEQNQFTREKWLAEPEHRTRIVDDLLEEHALVGMTEAQILELLGGHDNESGYFQQDGRMVYWLGPERGLMSIDSEWLILDFSGDVVADCFITTD